MYLSEMLDAVESKTGKPLFPQEERKADHPVEQIVNIPKAGNVEPPDNPVEPPDNPVEPPDDPVAPTLKQED